MTISKPPFLLALNRLAIIGSTCCLATAMLAQGPTRDPIDTSAAVPIPAPLVGPRKPSRPSEPVLMQGTLPPPPGDVLDHSSPGGPPDRTLLVDVEVPSPFDDFGAHTIVGSPALFPFCMNVKMFFTFPAGGGVWQGSGALIDPMHVITAGHCVFDASKGGYANYLEVIPGYHQGSRPFGTARMVNVMTYAAWTQQGDVGHDLAVIKLDRPIGARTGYFGYSWSTDWNYYNTPTWFLHGYPAVGGFDGQRLTQQTGWFDTETNGDLELRLRTPFIPGQSGSGFYRIEGSQRSIHAVASHNEWNWFYGWDADAMRITASRWVDIFVFILLNTPAAPDLVPMNVRTANSTLVRGTYLPQTDYLLHNYSLAAFSGGVSARLYISNDRVITTGDTLIGTVNTTTSTGAKGSIRITLPSLIVPGSITTGTKYLGIMLLNADANTSNNTVVVDEVAQVYVL